MNRSKVNDDRFWRRWIATGAVSMPATIRKFIHAGNTLAKTLSSDLSRQLSEASYCFPTYGMPNVLAGGPRLRQRTLFIICEIMRNLNYMTMNLHGCEITEDGLMVTPSPAPEDHQNPHLSADYLEGHFAVECSFNQFAVVGLWKEIVRVFSEGKLELPYYKLTSLSDGRGVLAQSIPPA